MDSNKSLHSYIFTISKNEVIDYFNKLNSNRKKVEEYYTNKIETPVDINEEQEILFKRLEEGICQLSEQRRKVIHLSYFDNMSYQEISEHLRISKNTVKNHLVKAKVSLRNYLA
ncbi:RNA polymerase sigma-70 factor (ECF subfamily) [Algoriphagus ratkowskyi]|uniref:RNA polymerase sigma-70 factor (ECF subfamily) n=1 Tax=Algoriphagus ratkowskyi TaxID=57028 RepID=A0A2W7R1Q4_9BACT|nr:sigma-70 family RNA polymerase sigma factor [Algoriphagus ratkowskyi]PZX54698.1 RNA polymerase sigma-70 factor (ECF subfamily) [Algoriphagus ratkowskyi]